MRVSKHEQIKAFLEAGTLTRQEIAAKVGCQLSYVRAVCQRIAGGGRTKADQARMDRIAARRRADPDFRRQLSRGVVASQRRRRDRESVTRIGAIQGDRAS